MRAGTLLFKMRAPRGLTVPYRPSQLTKEFLTVAKDQSRRIAPAVLESDRETLAALQGLTGYAPANPAFSVTAIKDASDALKSALDAEAQANAAAAAARDNAVKKEWEFHNLIVGTRDQVIAQFGKDSNEVQAVGLKKASEYKRPGRKTAPKTTPGT